MKTFTRYPSRVYLSLILKIIISTLWLLCIASAAFSSPVNKLAGPTLGQNPSPVTACSGSTVAFTVGSVSAGATTKWQVSVNGGTTYSDLVIAPPYSATAVTLTITGISTTLNGNKYRLVATDINGTTNSLGAAVTVNASPAVSSTPTASIKCVGASGGLSVDSNSSLSFQWQVSTDNGTSWSNVTDAGGYSGSNTYSLTYPAATLAMNGYLYRYIDTVKATGCFTTSIALDTLHIYATPVFPGTGFPLPISATICPGTDTAFTAAPTGGLSLAYRWQWKFAAACGTCWVDVANDAVYSGAQTNTLRLTAFQPAAGSNNLYNFRMVASYVALSGCAKASNPSTLNIRTLASIAPQPNDTTVCNNSVAGFNVTATGTSIKYQWQTDNGSNGALWANVIGVPSTAALLNLGVVTTAMNGYKYRVIVSNACSPPATSDPKTLSVITGGVCTVLASQLQSFTVQKTGSGGTNISWKIDPQYAVKYFSVQRSADGVRYMSIGQVNGETGKTSYGFTDNTPGNGTVYYRLQVTGDHDDVVFSPVQKLQAATADMAQLRPSVTTASSTIIYINLAQQSAVSVYLTDVMGQVHVRETISLNKGEHQLPLWIGGLGKGVYYVHVSDGKGNTNVLTLAKQ